MNKLEIVKKLMSYGFVPQEVDEKELMKKLIKQEVVYKKGKSYYLKKDVLGGLGDD